jgi:hypothetical protein
MGALPLTKIDNLLGALSLTLLPYWKPMQSLMPGRLLLGAFFAEGPLSKNTFDRTICKQTQVYTECICRSYNPGSFGMTTRLETKGSTDLKRKRPFSPC